MKGDLKVLQNTRKEKTLSKGVYTDKELDALIGMELKTKFVLLNDFLKKNKLENVKEMVISLKELDNSDNLEDGKPSNTLFTYYATDPEYSTCFERVTPQ